MRRGWMTRGVLAVTACAVLAMLLWPREQAIEVRTVRLEQRAIEDCVMGAGLIGRQDTRLISSQTGGRVAAMYVRPGEWVQAGQALLRLDAGALEQALAQSVRSGASLTAFSPDVEATLRDAQREDAQTLAAQVAAQTIRAQQAGQVLYTFVRDEEVLRPGSPALTLAGAQACVTMQVGERDAARLREGMAARFVRDGEIVGTGTVTSVGLPMAREDGVSLAQVEIAVQGDLGLPVGSRVDVEIVCASRESAYVLPIEAFSQDEEYVWQIYRDRVWPLALETGLQDDFGVEVLGAPAALCVAVEGAQELEPGALVKAVM